MSVLDQKAEMQSGTFLDSPVKKYLEVKNHKDEIEVEVKGKKKMTSVFDRLSFQWSEKVDDEYQRHLVELPVEFAIIDSDWKHYKVWDKENNCFIQTNEVSKNDEIIKVRRRGDILFEFTMNELWEKEADKQTPTKRSLEVKAKLKELDLKQYSSIYAAMKNEEGVFELINFQLKGSQLSGLKDEPITGYWNINKVLTNKLPFKEKNEWMQNAYVQQALGKKYTNFHQFNDWLIGELDGKEYGVLNWTLGGEISADEAEEIKQLALELDAYHKEYRKKGTPITTTESVPFEEDPADI